MAIKVFCDGCGLEAPEPAEFGEIWKCVYCETCLETVQAFYADRDKLHDEVKAKWDKGLKKLADSWLKEHPNGRLPDT